MSDLNTQAQTVTRSQNRLFKVSFSGLAPNTIHYPYLDGVDHTFATKQFGKDYGEELITDENGDLDMYFMREIVWNRTQNFELPENPSVNYQNNQLGSQSFASVKNIFVFEVRSITDESHAQMQFETNILLTAGAGTSLFPIE